ncbi:MAG TPA: dienelactone hydrolase family protein [Nocardioides sp.]|nr:dienelactone hydrolase family protein [Nocardioides sp.]
MTHATRLRAAAVLATAAVTVAGLAMPADARRAEEPGPTSYAVPGPYAVGERTLKLPSGARVEVWYPARHADVAGRPVDTYDVVDWLPDLLAALVPEGASVAYPSGGVRAVPVARGRFPLVVFSHGFAGFRDQSTFLTSALASWGFVVAAPDHPSRNLTKVLGGPAGSTTDIEDLRATITLIGKRTERRRSWLHDRVDLRRIGAVGHSAGGRAVENLAVVDRRVDTFVGMAGASVGALDGEATVVPRQPGLLLAGTADTIVALDRMEQAYAALTGPRRFVLLGGAGHLAFSDLCEVGASDGGLIALAELLGVPIPDALVPLATDGCIDPVLPATEAWPAIQHVVVAHLRRVLGPDRTDAALTGLVEAYPGIVTDSRSDG